MPDYHDKNIPVLDDIIEIDVLEEEKDRRHFEPENESLAADNIPGQLSEEIVHSVTETDEPQIGEIEDIEEEPVVVYQATSVSSQTYEYTETENTDTLHYQPATEGNDQPIEKAESALIYDQQEQAGSVYQEAVSAAPDKYDNGVDEPLTVNDSSATKTLALETIVEDVVKQLIPDLEQQLRYLVQQALEDRLPAELLSRAPSDENDS